MAIGRVKTKVEKSGEIVAYSELAVRNNASVVEYCRTSMAALSGGTAGLLGLTGFYGFGFYVFAVVGLWMLILLKAGSNWKKYFISRRTLLTNGFFGSLFTYVLFWTYPSLFCMNEYDLKKVPAFLNPNNSPSCSQIVDPILIQLDPVQDPSYFLSFFIKEY